MAHKVWMAFVILCIGKSIAELCQEGQLEGVTGNCFNFRLCKEKQWYEQICTPPHQVFDSFQSKCVSIRSYCLSQTRSNDNNCTRELCDQNLNVRCTDGQTKTLGCRHYSQCISGAWVQAECNKGETVKRGKCAEGTCLSTPLSCNEYIINGKYIYCESGYYFDENLSKCTPGFCESQLAKERNACTEGEVKIVEGTCKKYKKCTGGTFVDEECSQCQNFDENSGKCVFIWDKPCSHGGSSTTIHPTSTPSSTTSTPSSTTSTPTDKPTTTTTSPPSKCLTGQRKPDYGNCNYYFECNEEGNWQNKSCWWFFFFHFDVDSYKCKFWTAKCAQK